MAEQSSLGLRSRPLGKPRWRNACASLGWTLRKVRAHLEDGPRRKVILENLVAVIQLLDEVVDTLPPVVADGGLPLLARLASPPGDVLTLEDAPPTQVDKLTYEQVADGAEDNLLVLHDVQAVETATAASLGSVADSADAELNQADDAIDDEHVASGDEYESDYVATPDSDAWRAMRHSAEGAPALDHAGDEDDSEDESDDDLADDEVDPVINQAVDEITANLEDPCSYTLDELFALGYSDLAVLDHLVGDRWDTPLGVSLRRAVDEQVALRGLGGEILEEDGVTTGCTTPLRSPELAAQVGRD